MSATGRRPATVAGSSTNAAFEVGGVVREKIEVIQALRRELAERDAQLEHAREIAAK